MKAIKKIFSGKAIQGAIGKELTQAYVLADLVGRHYATRDMRAKAFKYGAVFSSTGDVYFQEAETIPSTYADATKWFRVKGIITAQDLKGIETQGFKEIVSMAEDARDVIQQRIGAKLDYAIRHGQDLKQWYSSINEVLDPSGLTELNPSYWQLVLRNATQASFNNGKKLSYQLADPEEFPQMQILTVGDNRVRPAHRKFNGFTASKIDPIWNRLTPPFDHACRCTLTVVHAGENIQNTTVMPEYSNGFGFVGGRPLPKPKPKKAPAKKAAPPAAKTAESAAEFTPAKSIPEAIKFAEKNLASEVGFKNSRGQVDIPLKDLNTINKYLWETQKEYGFKLSKLGWQKEVSGRTYKATAFLLRYYNQPNWFGIGFNKAAWKRNADTVKRTTEFMNEKFNAGRSKTRYYVSGNFEHDAVIRHEVGHYIYYKTGYIREQFEKKIQALRKELGHRAVYEMAAQVSEYATSKVTELFAEIRATVMRGQSSLVPKPLLEAYKFSLKKGGGK